MERGLSELAAAIAAAVNRTKESAKQALLSEVGFSEEASGVVPDDRQGRPCEPFGQFFFFFTTQSFQVLQAHTAMCTVYCLTKVDLGDDVKGSIHLNLSPTHFLRAPAAPGLHQDGGW